MTSLTKSQEYPSFALQNLLTHKSVKLVFYYLLLLLMSLVGIIYGYYFSEQFFATEKLYLFDSILNGFKIVWLIPLPYAILNFYSFIRYPVFNNPQPKPVASGFAHKLYFRYITRGLNPNLIADNVATAYVLLNKVLPQKNWLIEVVTDHPLDPRIDDECVQVILVPTSYNAPNGSKYKARSLHYAIYASTARPNDWIVHLDEETQFEEATIKSIYQFASEEHQDVLDGKRKYARIGQGVILYGARKIMHWVTTLADSIRVGDDYGRFRLQYEHGKAYFGMHGSFIVIQNRVEKAIGMDHGPSASITEDAYFALVAQSMGIEFAFINTYMYEKSPFSIKDFIKQRRRWFGGLWLCATDKRIRIKERFILVTFMVFWSFSWLCILIVYVNIFRPTGTPTWLAICGGVSFAYYICLYLIGFLQTFRWQDGKRRFLKLLLAQILFIPAFSFMESVSVIYGLLVPPKEFYIVQKEM
ncbi:MAG: glycosyltransferase family 2 protein [Anaerolineales bacterium]|nr:glycosyltransferase family 2 protein [Anaerolineales bacterium]